MSAWGGYAKKARQGVERRVLQRLEGWSDQLDPHWARLRQKVGTPPLGDHRDVPVVINNFNRVIVLEQLVDWLRRAGMRRIYILDNASTYPPVLDYYRRIEGVTVVPLGKNIGFRALWRSRFFLSVAQHYYVYTDPDVLPVQECPLDVVLHLHQVLMRFADKQKAGLGLKIDDLPDCYTRKNDVVQWEQKYWQRELAPGVFDAPVDTTFALYRPWARGGWWIPSVRTGGPLLLRHMPWYADSNAPDDEERFYQRVIRRESSQWTTKDADTAAPQTTRSP